MPIHRHFACFGRSIAKSAFSLIEVTIAVGIAGFVLAALVGLMAVGLDASRRAAEDTTVAGLAGTVVSRLQEEPFVELAGTQTLYFTRDGALAGSGGGDEFYQCDVEVSPHTAGSLPEGLRRGDLGVRIRMTFFWPPENPQPKEIFETTIAKY